MPSHAELVEQLRWRKFPVLDDGFVCLVDIMGDDSSVVQAARVSYGQGTRAVSDDRTLIRYLMRHQHTTPFEMVELKFLVRVPMDCWRQWIRHRTASINEMSTRYSVADDAMAVTAPTAWRKQATMNRQGSEGFVNEALGAELSSGEADFHRTAREVYQGRLQQGVAREQARKDLPLSTYTEAYWKIDLHNLLHFLELRMDDRAQWEIRQYALAMGQEIVRPLLPLVWEAMVDYRTGAMSLSRLEQEVVVRLAAQAKTPADEADFLAAGDPSWAALQRCRERDECREKLVRLGLLKA